MNEGRISGRYSNALFLHAKEKGLIDEVKGDMKFLLELSAHSEVKELLASPVIENSLKKKALEALIEGRVSALTMNLVMLTVDNNRESFLPGIARGYIALADKHKGITKVTLITAAGTGEKVKKAVSDLVSSGYKTEVDLEEIVDPSITGGFKLKIGDTLIDGSVKSQLRKIEKELKE